jgi:hypothetical protein
VSDQRNSLELEKLRLEIDALKAEIARRPAQTDADKKKTDLELKKLAEEIQALKTGHVRLSAELADLPSERERRRIEQVKNEREVRKLDRELGVSWFGRALAVVLRMTPLTALALAFISGVTLWVNWRGDSAKREAEEFHRIVSEFGGASSAARAGAAVLLGQIACCDEAASRRTQAQALLLAGVGGEREFNVRRAIEDSLIRVGSVALQDVQARRAEVERELRIVFGRGPKPKCASFKDDELAKVRALQEGVLTLARTTVQGGKTKALDLRAAPFRCALLIALEAPGAQFTRAVLWQADLSRSNLANADFTDAQLDEADLDQAEVRGARFCGGITGLTVEMLKTAKGWEAAYYPNTLASVLSRVVGRTVSACG